VTAPRAASPEVTFEELHSSLKERPISSFTAGELAALSRRLQALGRAADVRLAYLGNVTLDFLAPVVSVLAARRGLLLDSYIAPYGQHVQALLDEDGTLRRHDPDVILLVLSLTELRGDALAEFPALEARARKELMNEILVHLEQWIDMALERFSSTLLIATFPHPARPMLGLADLKEEYGETEFYAELNLGLVRACRKRQRAVAFDLARVVSFFGARAAFDPKMALLARMPWSRAFLPYLAEELVRYLLAVRGRARKCVVVDLDNTLWGGVVGEDGIEGLNLGGGDPEGEAYFEFQRRLKALTHRGVLLAICSKNNLEDALEVFRKRQDMPLAESDFAMMAINWEPKPVNLERIAQTLNIGLDSLVLIDDSPAEISLVRQTIPEVRCVLLPEEPADYVAALDEVDELEKVEVLREDREKTHSYRQQAQRAELRLESLDLGSYLASLKTRVRIHRVEPSGVARAHQLFSKTNQFNLTTRRYSLGDVERFLTDPTIELWQLEAGDRFGELGTIALALLRLTPQSMEVDSFLMSCRAMGRGIETAAMNHVKRRFLASGREELHSLLIPTPKNVPVRDFYLQQGLRRVERTEEWERYSLSRAEAEEKDCSWIQVEES